jgi:hypothetical protein
MFMTFPPLLQKSSVFVIDPIAACSPEHLYFVNTSFWGLPLFVSDLLTNSHDPWGITSMVLLMPSHFSKPQFPISKMKRTFLNLGWSSGPHECPEIVCGVSYVRAYANLGREEL